MAIRYIAVREWIITHHDGNELLVIWKKYVFLNAKISIFWHGIISALFAYWPTSRLNVPRRHIIHIARGSRHMLVVWLWPRHFYILRCRGGYYTSVVKSGFGRAVVQRQIVFHPTINSGWLSSVPHIMTVQKYSPKDVVEKYAIFPNQWVKILLGTHWRLGSIFSPRLHGLYINQIYPNSQILPTRNQPLNWANTELW